MTELQRIVILCGHAGVGKTNLALNLARMLAREGEAVTLVDLDVVNPYFRSSDHAAELAQWNVRLIAPQLAGSTLDVPALSGAVDGALDGTGRLIIDAGGDDIGAAALGRFAPQLERAGEYELLYVINYYRALTRTPGEAAEVLEDVQARCHLRAAGLVNNSHLSAQTTVAHLEQALPFAQAVCALTGLPLRFSTAPADLRTQGWPGTEPVWLDRLVKNPWE